MLQLKPGDIIQIASSGKHPMVVTIDGCHIQVEYPRMFEDDKLIRRWIRIPHNYRVVGHV